MEGGLLQELQKISFASFRFHLRAATELHLPPYKGSTLRGAFGTVFKETVCVVEHRDCDRCILKLKCAYPYIFDTPIPEDSARMRKYERAPHPFVIDPPLDTSTNYEPGSSLSFGLTLIGKAIDYLPYFIYSFERMGADRGIGKGRRFGSGRFAIESVSWVDADGTEKPVYDGKRKILSNSFHPLTIRDLPESQDSKLITVHYLTPTRMTFEHQLHVTLHVAFVEAQRVQVGASAEAKSVHVEHDADAARAQPASKAPNALQGRQISLVLELDSAAVWGHFVMGVAYRGKRMFEEAIAAHRRAVQLSGGMAALVGWLGLALGLSGETAEARSLLDGLHEHEAHGYVPPTSFAWIHIGLSEVDSAFEWLNRGVEECDQLMMPIKSYEFLDPFRKDPRFGALLRKMNLEP